MDKTRDGWLPVLAGRRWAKNAGRRDRREKLRSGIDAQRACAKLACKRQTEYVQSAGSSFNARRDPETWTALSSDADQVESLSVG